MKARVLFFPIVLFTLFTNTQAQSVNTISGSVFNDARRPVGQMYVELQTEFNSVVQRTQTNQSGHYSFTRVSYGKYVVKVRPYTTDYDEQERSVDIYNMSGDPRRPMPMYEQVDFYLIPRRNSAAVPQITGIIFAQDVPKEARDLYQSVDANDTSETAVQRLKNAIDIFPRYHDALVRLGSIYNQGQKFSEAESAFTTVVDVNRQGFAGWYGLGYAQFSLNDPTCIASLKKALEIDKSSVNSWFILGLAQRKAKEYGDALTSLKQAKTFDEGRTPDISWNLALLYYYNLKKPAEAADELEYYLKIYKEAKNKDQIKALIKKFRSEISS